MRAKDSWTLLHLRLIAFDVPPQEILSKDSVTVKVDAVVYFRIEDATLSVEYARNNTQLLSQTALRNILSTKTLAEMLSDRAGIAKFMQVTVISPGKKSFVAMAAEAEASREAKDKAKIIVAEGASAALRGMRDAANIISQSPAALQLRYLQTLNNVAAEKNSTIIFPLPIDLISAFLVKAASA